MFKFTVDFNADVFEKQLIAGIEEMVRSKLNFPGAGQLTVEVVKECGELNLRIHGPDDLVAKAKALLV